MDQQAALEEQKKNCIFCKIISGEQESKKVYEDPKLFGVLDINPWVKGHVLLTPKDHAPILPLLPQETFTHLFETLPQIAHAVKDSMLCTGVNIVIANGGVAGQQSPHFLLHVIPREHGDHLDLYGFTNHKHLDSEKEEEVNRILKNNIPLMMKKNLPPSKPKTASYLEAIKKNNTIYYEDGNILIASADHPQSLGHLVVYSQIEPQNYDHVSEEHSHHLFKAASLCATAVFEGLHAQGSNIILKSGISGDNPTGKLCIHILPREKDDGLEVVGTPMKQKPNLDQVASNIKDKTFILEHEQKHKKKKKVEIDIPHDIKEEISNAIHKLQGH